MNIKYFIPQDQLRDTLGFFIDILNAYAFNIDAGQLRKDVFPKGSPTAYPDTYVMEKFISLQDDPAKFWGQLDSVHRDRFFCALIRFATDHNKEWAATLKYMIKDGIRWHTTD